MDPKNRAKRVGIAFIVLFIIAGLVLMYTGNDAVVLAVRQKEGLLTAEQVKMSFDSVSGRLVREAVQEGDDVKAGDIIMELDATDNTLALARIDAQLAQIEAQITGRSTSIGISMQQVGTNETQTFRQIDAQRAVVDSARATQRNSERDYERMTVLLCRGGRVEGGFGQRRDACIGCRSSNAPAGGGACPPPRRCGRYRLHGVACPADDRTGTRGCGEYDE